MAKSFQSETRYRHNWSVTIYAASKEAGFYTECISPNGTKISTDICSDRGSAWQQGYSLVDRAIAFGSPLPSLGEGLGVRANQFILIGSLYLTPNKPKEICLDLL
ncbi:MAG: hypothetical protein KME17_10375 [Cyanosarcina radialis HA8281-LM2]|nr:hypothetical protein [Cyanosarcina radialis HA8281-LM2]